MTVIELVFKGAVPGFNLGYSRGVAPVRHFRVSLGAQYSTGSGYYDALSLLAPSKIHRLDIAVLHWPVLQQSSSHLTTLTHREYVFAGTKQR